MNSIPQTAWISAIVTIGIFVLSHIGITIWWASRVSTLLQVVQSELKTIVVEFKESRNQFFTREEAAREIEIQEREHKAIWKRIDELRESNLKGAVS